VLVGAEDASVGASVVGFFPDTVTIHVGDTVRWKRNVNEIHTVTFLAGTPLPDFTVPAPPGLGSPIMRNPVAVFPNRPANGRYDGTTFANSGIFGPDPDLYQGVESFELTFTRPGTYSYVCVVHGVRMSGQVNVVHRNQHIASPHHVRQEAKRLIDEALEEAPFALALAEAEVPPPTLNDDGTTTHYVLVGFSVEQLDLLHFFPDELTVQPGDTVEWMFSMEDVPRHTITFLNGSDPPDDVIVVPQDNGPPLILVNPEVLLPQNAGQPLTREGVRSSGVLLQADPPPTFSLRIGDISGEEPYRCLLHDSSGMLATLNIEP
jgi:plastocyanin